MKKDFNTMTVKEKIQYICVFLPILSTVTWGVTITVGEDHMNPILTFIGMFLLVVGFGSALVFFVITDFIGFLKFILAFIVKGWTIGMAVCPLFPICFITAVFGFAIAFEILFLLCIMLPVALTVYFYFFRK